MKLRNSVNGNVPFEGDRTFRWRTIPANAKILSATATVTPIDGGLDGSFAEALRFNTGSVNFGATKTTAVKTAPAPAVAWVEVDFHSRRTLASAAGNFLNTTLQVDVGGGTYVEINKAGAFKTPSDGAGDLFVVSGGFVPLPGLTVAKLKLTNPTTIAPDLTSITIRSLPTNVSVKVGDLPPFYTHVGELTNAETTADFAAVLQAALTTAKVENGFYDLPITVHSDSIARLKIEIEIDVLAQQEVLSKAVPEVVLPFDFSTLAKSKTASLSIEVPANSRVVPGATSARVRGAFAETRVAAGPTGPDNPTAAVELSSRYSQSQILVLDQEVSAVAIDLLLEALTPSARLQLDIRGDFDGKPDEIPLLPAPVELRIEQQAKTGAAWTTVPLPAEFLFAKGQEDQQAIATTSAKAKLPRYWLLLQCLEGRASWSVLEIPKTPPATDADVWWRHVLPETSRPPKDDDKILNMQSTRDGGLSWQDTLPPPGTVRGGDPRPPFVGFFRLRDKPKTFKMPIQLQVGIGEKEVRKRLDRFEPLGRVDFTLDTELAAGINEYLANSAAPLPETEHLLNADFEQWSRVGNSPVQQPLINLSAAGEAVAFSPDGALAYVLDDIQEKNPFLLTIDVACNQEITEKAIPLAPFAFPNAFVISPDGTRAYITNGSSLRIVDLAANQVVAGFFDLTLVQEGLANDLAISPDGRVLYIANLRPINTGLNPTKSNRIRVIDTAKLEQQLTTGVAQTGTQTLHDISAGQTQTLSPRALALSPDGSVLFLVIALGAGANGVVTRINTNTFAIQGQDIPVGINPSAIGLTPNGKVAVVTSEGSNVVSMIDTATDTVVPVTVDAPQIDVSVSSDGASAYVLLKQFDRLITVIDLDQRSTVKTFGSLPSANFQPAAFALAPAEDQIYTVVARASVVAPVQMGTRVPAEWQLTSGEVRPLCVAAPFHLIAMMGAASLPTSFSQVIPVAESYAYEFSFWGIAVEPETDGSPAIAEVLWLNQGCGLLQTDTVPIEVIDVRREKASSQSDASFAALAEEPKRFLRFHRKQLMSPAGANQAEVRFSTSKEIAALIDLVSLSATSELAANGDFQQQKDGQLVGWTFVPNAAPGFVTIAGEEGIELRNAGGAQVEVVQTVAAESGRPFALELQGRGTAAALTEQSPRIELRWLKSDGSASGPPVAVEILPTGLDSTLASGTVPEDTAQTEIHIVVPAKATLALKRVSLRYPATTIVPVSFIAEAPGEMTVSDVRIAFEEVEVRPPQVPEQGLCTSTPPGGAAGKGGKSCYCHRCETETAMSDARAVMTEAGRPATIGRCSTCRSEVLRAGGPLVAGAQPLSLLRSNAPSPVIVQTAGLISASDQFKIPAQPAELTAIRGIGEARAKQLTEIGIDSVEKLAASTAESVAKIKFITPEMASRIIGQAKSLTGS